MIVRVPQAGAIGVNKDLSASELSNNAWTSALNIRFLDGMAGPVYGYGQVYGDPSYPPQHVLPCNVGGNRTWVYCSSAHINACTIVSGSTLHSDISPTTARAGVSNKWTSTLLSGLPIINAGDGSSPLSWGLDMSSPAEDLANWPGGVSCKSLRAFKSYLVALSVTKDGQNYPYMVKWSNPADPGSVPSSWDETDPTTDCGEMDLADGYDPIVDGLQLRDYFMIYKENSTWRMAFIGGDYIFSFTRVSGNGAMNVNCIAEVDGYHVVLTGDDVVLHDGQSATSILDKQTRRYFFQHIDIDHSDRCFVFTNPFFNEVLICYPEIGSEFCNMALVWNYVDKTVSFRSLPDIDHASTGPVDNSLAGLWNQDDSPWDTDLSLWNQPDFVPSGARVLMASSNVGKLYMLDSSSSFDGENNAAYIERRGLSFSAPETIKTVKGIRPRISGNNGMTVKITVGASDDPFDEPRWGNPMNHVVGKTVQDNCFVSGRYIALRFETGSAYQWRLDSFDIDVEKGGMF